MISISFTEMKIKTKKEFTVALVCIYCLRCHTAEREIILNSENIKTSLLLESKEPMKFT